QVSANTAQKAADKKLRIFDEMLETQRRQIDIYGTDMQRQQDKDLAAAANAGKSTDALKADYAKRERERQLSIYDLTISQAEDEYDHLRGLLNTQSGQEKDATERALAGLSQRVDQAKLARAELEKAPIGVPVLSKPLDEDKLYKKGTEALQKLKDSIEGVRADLQGANGDVIALQSALMAGKYGPIDSGRVKELIEQLLKAKAEKQALDDLMEGKTKFDNDASALELKLQQQIFEEQTRGMSEVDKWKAKINSGYYKGIGPGSNPLVQQVTALNDGFVTAKTAGEQLATSVQTKLFGTDTINGGNTVVGIIKQAVEQIAKMKEGITGIGGAISGVTSSSQNGGTIQPNTSLGAGGEGISSNYLNRLIKQESGGKVDAAAETSSAVGLGQFIETTWLKFLQDMHPE
ncbi:MAG: hypothetical protein K2Q20_14945, partial [Phycisphaerales bacterium]|nr:hypothetical protein [Phycisphaerales bacterium]